MKTIIVGVWDAKNPDKQTSYLYHGIKSNVIKDRLLYDYTDDIIIYAQYN